MRDIVLEETIYIDFTTRAFATGIPTVLAGTPVCSVLEENNATPITAGVSISVDRASVVGLNMATIVATAANGYEAGKGYTVYISTGTVASVSVVGEAVGHFTIAASAAAQDLANGTDGLGAIKAETALILTDTAVIGAAGAGLTALPISDANITQIGGDATSATDLKDFADDGYDPATNKVTGVLLVDTATTLTNTVTLADSATHGGTSAVLTLERLIAVSTTAAQPGILAMGSTTGAGMRCVGGANGDGLSAEGGGTSGHGVNAEAITAGSGMNLVAVGGNRGGMAVVGTGTAGDLDGSGGSGDLNVNIIGNVTGNLSGSVGSVTGAVGSVAGNVDGNVTGSIGSIVANAVSASALATDAVEEIRDAITGGTYPLDTDANGAIRIVDGTGARELNTDTGAIVLVGTCSTNTDMRGTNNAMLASTYVLASGASDSGTTLTMVDSVRTESDDDYWKGAWIKFTSGNIAGQARLITAFTAASDTITFAPATTQAVATQSYEIIPGASVEDVLALGTAGAGLTDLGGMSTAMKSEVNVEVLDVMDTDTITLPGQEAPTVTPTHREAISYLYKAFRNRKFQNATEWRLYADNQTTVDQKATVSDDTTTAEKGEVATGP